MVEYSTEALLHAPTKPRERWTPVRVIGAVRTYYVLTCTGIKNSQRLVRVLVDGEREPRDIEVSRLREPPADLPARRGPKPVGGLP